LLVFPDGRRLLYEDGNASSRTFNLLDLEDHGAPCLRWQGPRDPVRALALSPSGDCFLTAGEEGVRLYGLQGWKQRRARGAPMRYHERHWRDGELACFSGDGSRVLGVTKDRFHLWQVADGRPASAFDAPEVGRPTQLAWSHDGRWAFTCNANREMWLWDLTTRRPVRHLGIARAAIHCAVFTADGGRLLVAEGEALRVCEVPAGKWMHPSSGHRGGINSITLSADGGQALTAADDRSVRLWRLPE
jgi:WD40 repeat protein